MGSGDDRRLHLPAGVLREQLANGAFIGTGEVKVHLACTIMRHCRTAGNLRRIAGGASGGARIAIPDRRRAPSKPRWVAADPGRGRARGRPGRTLRRGPPVAGQHPGRCVPRSCSPRRRGDPEERRVSSSGRPWRGRGQSPPPPPPRLCTPFRWHAGHQHRAATVRTRRRRGGSVGLVDSGRSPGDTPAGRTARPRADPDAHRGPGTGPWRRELPVGITLAAPRRVASSRRSLWRFHRSRSRSTRVNSSRAVVRSTFVGPLSSPPTEHRSVDRRTARRGDRSACRRRARPVQTGWRQSSVISASRMTAASLPPNLVENTVMPTKLYSGGASFISLCMVPVRFVASRV